MVLPCELLHLCPISSNTQMSSVQVASNFGILVMGLKLGGMNQTTENMFMSNSFVISLLLFTFPIHIAAAHNTSGLLVFFSHT